ncbi:MAG TPA: hypothetical protein VNM40_01995 [Candidatus Paceibacterota bacterium]|nr:hypothetical protein [Candidatus Paceibacterota bacterium]
MRAWIERFNQKIFGGREEFLAGGVFYERSGAEEEAKADTIKDVV